MIFKPRISWFAIYRMEEKFHQIKSNKELPLLWEDLIYEEWDITSFDNISGKGKMNYQNVLKIKDMEEIPQPVIYRFDGKDILLFGEEIIFICVENDISKIPVTILICSKQKHEEWIERNEKRKKAEKK